MKKNNPSLYYILLIGALMYSLYVVMTPKAHSEPPIIDPCPSGQVC